MPTPAFKRVTVDYLITGGARIVWEIHRLFREREPYRFLLQVGETSIQGASDWTAVGAEATNTFYAIDDSRRRHGKVSNLSYRVRLTTEDGVHYSDPETPDGLLDIKDWRMAQEINRKEVLRHRLATQTGLLLKRKRSGQPCPRCLDELTGEVGDSACPTCYGTAWSGGYYAPATFPVDIEPSQLYETRDEQLTRGSVSDSIQKARVLGIPELAEMDVWINDRTDQRFYVHEVQQVAEMRGVPIAAVASLRLAPYSDVIYGVPIT